tara:strand:+ start:6745 stop:7011 length:267 start_codon:yes stop_codon:yes gene_type:complete
MKSNYNFIVWSEIEKSGNWKGCTTQHTHAINNEQKEELLEAKLIKKQNNRSSNQLFEPTNIKKWKSLLRQWEKLPLEPFTSIEKELEV